MGIYIVCWLPFFVRALYCALRGVHPDTKFDLVVLWLGYSNRYCSATLATVNNRYSQYAESDDLLQVQQRVSCSLPGNALLSFFHSPECYAP